MHVWKILNFDRCACSLYDAKESTIAIMLVCPRNVSSQIGHLSVNCRQNYFLLCSLRRAMGRIERKSIFIRSLYSFIAIEIWWCYEDSSPSRNAEKMPMIVEIHGCVLSWVSFSTVSFLCQLAIISGILMLRHHALSSTARPSKNIAAGNIEASLYSMLYGLSMCILTDGILLDI